MKNSFLYSFGYKSSDKRKSDEKGEYPFEYKIFERKKRNIQIEKKYLENLKIDNQFVEKATKKINDYRKLHGINPLIQDDYLNKKAFILAEKKQTNLIYEDLLYKDSEDIGINFGITEKELEVEKLIDNWYNENKNYNFIEPIELECNNFTQMIWKNSKKFGIGYYYSPEKIEEKNPENKKYYYAALFYPAGNIPGEYKNNVFKKKVEKNKSNKDKIRDKLIDENEKQIKKEIEPKNKEIIGKDSLELYKINTKKIIKIFILLILIVYNLRKLYIEKNQ